MIKKKTQFCFLLAVVVLFAFSACGCEEEKEVNYCQVCGAPAYTNVFGTGASGYYCDDCFEDWKRDNNTIEGGVFAG